MEYTQSTDLEVKVAKTAIKRAKKGTFLFNEKSSGMTLSEVELEQRRQRRDMYKTLLVGGLSLGFSAWAIMLNGLYLVRFAFSIPFFTVPIMVRQRHQINQVKSYRFVHNQVRDEVSRLRDHNKTLASSIDDLESFVKRLQGNDQRLRVILRNSNTNEDEFTRLVREHKDVLYRRQEMEKAIEREGVLTTILNSNKEFKVTKSQFRETLLRLRANDIDVNSVSINYGEAQSISDLVRAAFVTIGKQDSVHKSDLAIV
jgi:hypothetical protein